uniref:CSON003258 protein n=1 Tax=Culicoides sonorensis TaxID=179676 RepID=A0A336MQK1_CULSO
MNTTVNSTSKRSWIDESKRSNPDSSIAKPAATPKNESNFRILSGNVEFALRCAKMLPSKNSVLLEIFGTIMSVKKAKRNELIILLRNENGPFLQVSYFSDDFQLIEASKNVRCVCRMKSTGGFHALKIQAVEFCYEYIARLQAISVHILKKLVNHPELL